MHSNQKIRFYQNDSGGRFYIGDYAEMTFINTAVDIISIDHTRINNDHRGEGLAQQLYTAMIEHARQDSLRVIPTCSFVQSMFARNPHDQNLLAPK